MSMIESIKKARKEKGKWIAVNDEGHSIRFNGCGNFEECWEGYDSEISNNGYWCKVYPSTQSELLNV